MWTETRAKTGSTVTKAKYPRMMQKAIDQRIAAGKLKAVKDAEDLKAAEAAKATKAAAKAEKAGTPI